MNYRIDPAARLELMEAARWYEARRANLGREFMAEARRAVGRILAMPSRFPRVSLRARWCPLKRFPYRIVYRQEAGGIAIYAVVHLARRPGYWRK